MSGRLSIDRVELASGCLVLALGAGVVLESLNYPMGQLSSIGPGLFPRALGGVLVLCGIGLIATSVLRDAPLPTFKWRAAAVVAAALLVFALAINTVGLVPAIIGLVVVARLSEPGFRPVTVLTIACILAILSWLIFVLALGLPIPVLRWPG